MLRITFALGVLLFTSVPALAQPTYKLDVKPNLKPLATLKLEGNRITRTALKDDPGFRLQYHIKKDGKTVSTVEGRANLAIDAPAEAGTYVIVLELFYPAYKGGTAQKGEFKAVSNPLTCRVEVPAKPGEAPKVVLVEAPMPPVPAPKK
jgi:hypothetical protein